MKKSLYSLVLILVISACGKNAAQVESQNVPACKNTQEQLDATIELIRNHKVALLELLRSEENKDTKVASIERLYSEVKSFDAANNSICRDPDGTARSATMGDSIEELLLTGIDDVKSDKPVAPALISELDPGALERMERATQLAQKIPEMLQNECGLELKFTMPEKIGDQTKIEPISTKRIDDAVALAINSDPTKAETVTLWKLIESLNNVTFLINDEFIKEIGYAAGKTHLYGWNAVGDYLKILSSNLTDVMNHLEGYRKDPTKKPNIWVLPIQTARK
ncbi:MAG: hypothetical protein JST80_03760 [Bdellovibrionales bacterium]|nr:hypothetical protein [Bdellovibrionales bacterium]